MKIIIVAGARPNFMKIAPIMRELEKHNLQPILVHTGQHYDYDMSETFFDLLDIKKPDYNLGIARGSRVIRDPGSHAHQVAQIMERFNGICLKEEPDLVIVVGDVNSTIAAALVAKTLHIKLVHVEAGLRSYDELMPEEINRIVTDSITDIFFTTEKQGTENLLKEGHLKKNIYFVGNVMIDNLYYQLEKLGEKRPSDKIIAKSMIFPVEKIKNRLPKKYICMTMHRPENVDDKNTLRIIIDTLNIIAETMPIIFSCHPRTQKQISLYGFQNFFKSLVHVNGPIKQGLYITPPLDYDDFLTLWKDATLVITDSGGLQEETTALEIPCITIRRSTERPVTVEIGSNVVVNINQGKIIEYAQRAFNGEWKESAVPDRWDGEASKRIVEILLEDYK